MRRGATRRAALPVRPFLAAVLLGGWLAAAAAHEGHEHPAAPRLAGPAPSASGGWAATVEGAQRLADGAVFVPKAMQRQLGVRTVRAEAGDFARAIELNARVIADPNAGGRVQAVQAGRIEPAARGIATLGQRVRRGEVLAWLVPVADSLTRSAQQAALAEASAQSELAARRSERLRQLEGSVPQKDIDAARIEAEALAARRAALATGFAREALRAPIDGVVSVAAVSAGQLVEARATVFEVVDPARLAIEALAFDPLPASGLAGARVVVGGVTVPLDYLGAGRQLRDLALPVFFRVRAEAARASPLLAVGQPLKIVAQTHERARGVAVPAAAVVRGANNEAQVWVHDAPERFVPHRVRVAPIDAERVLVVEGLDAGERVVAVGAPALAQIR